MLLKLARQMGESKRETKIDTNYVKHYLTLSYLGEGADSAPLMFFFHHPETA